MMDGVPAHLMSFVTQHESATAQNFDVEEARLAADRSLTVVRLFGEASPTFRDFVIARCGELLQAALLYLETFGVSSGRGGWW